MLAIYCCYNTYNHIVKLYNKTDLCPESLYLLYSVQFTEGKKNTVYFKGFIELFLVDSFIALLRCFLSDR